MSDINNKISNEISYLKLNTEGFEGEILGKLLTNTTFNDLNKNNLKYQEFKETVALFSTKYQSVLDNLMMITTGSYNSGYAGSALYDLKTGALYEGTKGTDSLQDIATDAKLFVTGEIPQYYRDSVGFDTTVKATVRRLQKTLDIGISEIIHTGHSLGTGAALYQGVTTFDDGYKHSFSFSEPYSMAITNLASGLLKGEGSQIFNEKFSANKDGILASIKNVINKDDVVPLIGVVYGYTNLIDFSKFNNKELETLRSLDPFFDHRQSSENFLKSDENGNYTGNLDLDAISIAYKKEQNKFFANSVNTSLLSPSLSPTALAAIMQYRAQFSSAGTAYKDPLAIDLDGSGTLKTAG